MKIHLSILVLTLIFFSCAQETENSNLTERKEKIEEMEIADLSKDQIERKNLSTVYCKKHNIPTIDHLPCIESESETKIRGKDEIVNRALALCYLGLKSEGLEKIQLDEFENKYEIRAHFSNEELSYVNSDNPEEQQIINANWRYESLHVLLWAMGYIDKLSYPSDICDVANDVKIIFEKSRIELIENTNIRRKKEILNEADLIYRIHWACVDARINNKQTPGKLNPSVVYERHYVLNWLIQYMNQDWDNVSTDT